MIPKTCISLGLRSIPPGSGFAGSRKPVARATIGHHWAAQSQVKKDTGMMDKLLEYTLDKYQKRIDRLKQLKPNTADYEKLLEDIDRLQEKLEQIRLQIAERRG